MSGNHVIAHGQTEENFASTEEENAGNPRSTVVTHDAVDLPYHGSCSNCHHLHSNKKFTIFLDRNIHARLECEICGHPMCGIGRTSTQTTLASVESIPMTPRLNRNGSNLRSSSLRICVNTSASEGLQVNSPTSPDRLASTGQLSTITEINTSTGRSQPISNQRAPESTNEQEARETDRARRSSTGLPETYDAALPESGAERQLRDQHSSRHRFQAFFHRALNKKRFLVNSKVGNFFVTKFKVPFQSRQPSRQRGSVSTVREDNGPPISQPTLRHMAAEPEMHSNTERNFPHGETQAATTSDSIPPTQPIFQGPRNTDDDAEPSEPSNIADQSPHQGTSLEQPTITEQNVVDAKRARITARRKEQTRQSQVAARPICQCHPGCLCLGGHEEVSDNTSESRGTIPSISEIPDHPLRRLRTSAESSTNGDLTGIGAHLSPNPRMANAVERRFSQAPTMCDSNDSSISLTSGSHASGRTSVMLTASYRRSGSLDIARLQPNGLPLHHSQDIHEGIRTGATPLRNQTTISPTASISANDGESLTNVSSERASSASLNHISDPQSEEGEAPSIPNGIIMYSHAESLNGTLLSEDHERTPRPRSHLESGDVPSIVTATPENLSSALQDIVPEDSFRTA